jgi:hypothetical protein
MTEVRNNIFKEGDFVSHFRAKGLKVSKRIINMDKLLPELTPEEIEKLGRHMAIYRLTHDNLDPAERRELLKQFDICPCCQAWLGHNRPPADDGAPSALRQRSFNFDR